MVLLEGQYSPPFGFYHQKVHGDLVLGSITDQTLRVSESNIGRRSPVALIISYDLNTVMLPHPHARVSRSEINSDRRTITFSGHTSPDQRKHHRVARKSNLENENSQTGFAVITS
ncbi:hypothetical protein VitviT2T_008124 [Vitis vinifera]|uniref:Uncharacterized protein n=1 Tax=Vitis vinifera TaxID=29760 RepID=A0ABY9C154_VITVI|nr:hypothetical protein VitviT2T_008124 [Vitis vinifera]